MYYRHYKGGFYKVFFIARHTETLEPLVIYKQLRSEKIWARPLNMFSEIVEHKGVTLSRFQHIDEKDLPKNE